MNVFLEELGFVFLIDLVLWGLILIIPPIVIRVNRIKYFSVSPWGMAFLNIIIVVRDRESEPLLRHEIRHVQQQQLYSPIGMALVILFHYTWLFLKHHSIRSVYLNSFLERQANEAMQKTSALPKILYVNRK